MSSEFHVVMPAGAAQPDALGVWESRADPTPFAALAPSSEAAVRWQVVLPAGRAAASTTLAYQERLLAAAGAALPDADRRLREFVAGVPAAGESYALTAAGMPQPEYGLAMLLAESGDTASYGGPGDTIAELRKMAAEARGFVEQVQQTLRFYAQVETVQDGALLARTSVHWLGDAEVMGKRGIRADQAALHVRSVALALETRANWIRLATHFLASVALLGAGFATANPFMVAGGAWKFFKDVLVEWRRLTSQRLEPQP